MKNLRVYLPLVNGEQMQFEFDSGRALINELIHDALSAAPRSLVFEGKTADGKTVRVVIPYSDSDPARVLIESE